MTGDQRQPPIVPDAAQLERLRPWLDRFGINHTLKPGSLRFTPDASGMSVEWVDESGMQSTDFLDEDDWHDAQRLLRG